MSEVQPTAEVLPDVDAPASRRQRPIAIAWALLVFPLLCGVAWYGYGEYRSAKADQFETRCRAAKDESDWQRLFDTAQVWTAWDPQSAKGWAFLADAQVSLGHTVDAAQSLLHVPADDVQAQAAWLIASDLQLNDANEPLQGVKTLERIIDVFPQTITARQRLIYFHAITFQRTETINEIRAAIRASAEPPEAYAYLILADHLSFTNGVTQTTQWLKSQPDSETLQVARVLQLLDQIQTSESPAPDSLTAQVEQERDRLIEQYPDNLELFEHRLDDAVADHDVAEVGRLLQSAPASASQSSLVWRERGWYLARTNQLEKSEESLRKSLELHRLDWHTWHELAGVLRKTGQLNEAEHTTQIALTGKELRKTVVQLPNARALSGDLLVQIANYADRCGDTLVAAAIHTRLRMHGQSPTAAGG